MLHATLEWVKSSLLADFLKNALKSLRTIKRIVLSMQNSA